jgi:hypothetical protein
VLRVLLGLNYHFGRGAFQPAFLILAQLPPNEARERVGVGSRWWNDDWPAGRELLLYFRRATLSLSLSIRKVDLSLDHSAARTNEGFSSLSFVLHSAEFF